jgi:hypothetical protein
MTPNPRGPLTDSARTEFQRLLDKSMPSWERSLYSQILDLNEALRAALARAEKAEADCRGYEEALNIKDMRCESYLKHQIALSAQVVALKEALEILIKSSEEVLTAESNHNEEQAKRAGIPPGYRLLGGRWEINAAMHTLCNAVEHGREALNPKEKDKP